MTQLSCLVYFRTAKLLDIIVNVSLLVNFVHILKGVLHQINSSFTIEVPCVKETQKMLHQQSLSTTSIMHCQLLRQKFVKYISVMKTYCHLSRGRSLQERRQAFSLLCQYETGVHKLSLLGLVLQDSRPSKENGVSREIIFQKQFILAF